MYDTILLAIILGTAYYFMMSYSVPPELNCSFYANVWTDIFAFIFGAVLVLKAYQHNDKFILFIGVALITEHIWQFVMNKV